MRPRRALFAAVLAPAAVAAAVVASTPAQAANEGPTTYPYDAYITNPCTKEVVHVTGTLHEDYHTTNDSNGGVHGSFHYNLSGVSGIGDQGNKYQVQGNHSEWTNFNVGYESTLIDRQRYSSQGSSPNFTVVDHFHFTVNADGTTTSYHDFTTTGPTCD